MLLAKIIYVTTALLICSYMSYIDSQINSNNSYTCYACKLDDGYKMFYLPWIFEVFKIFTEQK